MKSYEMKMKFIFQNETKNEIKKKKYKNQFTLLFSMIIFLYIQKQSKQLSFFTPKIFEGETTTLL